MLRPISHPAIRQAPEIKYQIEYSIDGKQDWKPIVKDWTIPRRGDEPADFWSQSFCYGSTEIPDSNAHSVQVRFRNDGGKRYLRAEIHLVYLTPVSDATKVTFDWSETSGPRRETHIFHPGASEPWELKTGKNVQTRWVEFEPTLGRPIIVPLPRSDANSNKTPREFTRPCLCTSDHRAQMSTKCPPT
jgi:hypothetical protein